MDYDDLHQAIRTGAAAEVVPRWAVRYLDQVATGRMTVRALAHPLGFVCLPAWRCGGDAICVHIWTGAPAPVDPSTSGIHAHSRELVSYVLYGCVRNRVVAVTDAGPETEVADGPAHRVFEIHSDPLADTVLATPRLVHCRTESLRAHRRGDVYTLPSGVFHSSVADGPAATMALARADPGALDLFLGRPYTADHRVRRQRWDAERTRHAARVALARIGPLASPDLEDPCRCGK
jgi:hypothetical protein